jgi:hypothetical protein
MRDKDKMNDMTPQREADQLGPTTDIGAKLRALYSSVQDEAIPSRLLDLLERLDEAESARRPAATERK